MNRLVQSAKQIGARAFSTAAAKPASSIKTFKIYR